MKGKLESAIQAAIRSELTARGWMVAKCGAMSLNGWPDLVAIRGGRTVWIEVKRPGGVLSAIQMHRHGEMRKQGAEVYTVDGVGQVRALWGLR